MRLILQPVWSWPLLALVAGGLLLTVIITYRRHAAHLPAGQRRVLLALRIAAWALLVFAMLGLSLEFTQSDRESSVFVILADNSRSMGVHDGPNAITRRKALLATLDLVQKELQALGEDVELLTFDMSQGLTPVKELAEETPGEQTAIGAALEEVPNVSQNKRVAGVLLFSDGAERDVSPNSRDPRAAARRLAEKQIPVHTVGFGASGLADTAVDLAIEDLQVNPTVFEKNTVIVSAKLRALGAAGRELTLKLMIEDPAGAQPGEPPRMKSAAPPVKIRPALAQETVPVEVSFVAERAGEFRLSLEVTRLENEPVITNNALATFITVLRGGISVAYFDKLRPEQKFIRMISESPDIRLDFQPVRQGQKGAAAPFNADWFSSGKYDVYIIGDVPASAFGKELLDRLGVAISQGAGLLMTGGFSSFGPGGYGETPLADLLPVLMRPGAMEGEIDAARQFLEPLQMLPTAVGLHEFVMRLDAPARNMERWKSLPPLQGANKFDGLKPLARVLAESPAHAPLLVAQDVGRTRTMAFAGDTTWQWVLAGDAALHQRFWQQVILWLAHKDVQGDDQVWLRLPSRRFRPGQQVQATFGARDAEKRPITDAQFTVDVVHPDGRQERVPWQPSAGENLATFVDTQHAGEYRFRVEASKGGHAIGLGAQSRFLVYEEDLELSNPAADPSLLEEISRLTGGAHLTPEKLGGFLAELKKRGINPEVTKVTSTPLWDNWLVMALFVLLLTAEWIIRKKRGLV